MSGLIGTAVYAGSAQIEASPARAATACNLGNGVQHVINIIFDNVHFNRDNPNVLSDLEQMPHLLNFIVNNGTLLSNNHTPLIAHTADDSLATYTGLYGDRHGQPITNSYETYVGSAGPSQGVVKNSSFAYWTSTYSNADGVVNQPYSSAVPASDPSGASPPAPWVPFTRAGCDVGDASTANMVLENTSPDIANTFGTGSPEYAQYNADTDSFKDQETADYVGLALHCATGDAICANAQNVKYGQTSASGSQAPDNLPNEPNPDGTAASGSPTSPAYSGYDALYGDRYLNGPLSGAANSGNNRVVNGHTYPVTTTTSLESGNYLTDLNGNLITEGFSSKGPQLSGTSGKYPGFPGFSPTAAQSLAWVADMQEIGIPVTYAYISDVHEKKTGQTGCSSPGTALGPGDTCYQQNLAAYDAAFATFFQRLADDGITPQNTLFTFSSDEGDHFAGANVGRAVDPTSSCTGTAGTSGYTCSYPSGSIGEQQVNIHGLLSNQLGDTTAFYDEPQGDAIFITGNPGPTSATTRQLERDFAAAQADDTFDAATEKVLQYEADPTTEQLLHFVSGDGNRSPSFSFFPKPDFYMTAGTTDSPACASGVTQANAHTNCSELNNGFAWNHGYYAPEINNNWLGLVGPGVKNDGIDGSSAAQGPNSSASANSNPSLDTSVNNSGTWLDETDVRPTVLAILGLKDDYINDGRVLTEDLTITPGQTADPNFLPLARCYKQLNSSVGRFGTDVLSADTTALATGNS
ncbi:MAG: hypothetical protein JOY68_03560, partial [Candidatus Dormibacteraeota bacterium]|nr:hypothetical protein [Candidatus Dormibacteraeota bacterium]